MNLLIGVSRACNDLDRHKNTMAVIRLLSAFRTGGTALLAVIALSFFIFATGHAQTLELSKTTLANASETPVEPPVYADGRASPALTANSDTQHDLSPWGMFQTADIVVKSVMIGLALASVLTWTVFLAKSIELAGLKRRLSSDLKVLSGEDYPVTAKPGHYIGSALVQAVEAELAVSKDRSDREGIRERTASRLLRVEANAARRLSAGMGLLATIGSTAPFVGLFGTVWGIMNSFIGISEANTTNLAVVAPGIAEALLATGLGLAAAIPAVVFYNHFVRQIAVVKIVITDMSAALLRTASREVGRAAEA